MPKIKSTPRPFEKLALDLFKQAKEQLQANKSFAATVFLAYPFSIEVFELSFRGPQEKYASFASVVDLAARTRADAIITITDQRVRNLPQKAAREQFRKRYCQGDLEAEKALEELGMIVSPRDGPDWGLSAAYKLAADTGSIVFGRAKSNTRAPYTNNLVPESWKTASKAQPANRRSRQSV
ncbi:MAG TPA: hypothetical protein VGZ73_02115 [Bryobacteraceae bacterium]|jgi:hypothetical protein|nr:hypothetical protein [Bryobacteraceae bacterium]